MLNHLDEIIADNGGRVYPAKDARMSAQSFQHFYPQWQDFAQYVDPQFFLELLAARHPRGQTRGRERMRRILVVGATSAIAQETSKRFAAAGDSLFFSGA